MCVNLDRGYYSRLSLSERREVMKKDYVSGCRRQCRRRRKVTPDKLTGMPRIKCRLWFWSGLVVLFPAVMLTAAPVLANVMPSEDVMVMRQNNVRKLRLLNQCMGCDLEGVSLMDVQLVGADLRGANLFAANLAGSDLTDANLAGANLTGVNLAGAALVNTNLSNARLDWVNFSDAELNTVNLVGATTQNINLMGARLENTFISIGGQEGPVGAPLEPIIPFEDTKPPGARY